ncbi:ABC transporter ATP-binding protein [uncultured Cocleimonas sp.]|uniref:ABC transporter ATP-binding protein n=1 Tax=uncultured Cocleimonas sp. TaxID=1051587 RepID=UPI0026291834|nr:ABC transporter ATP-binding protein [uncultured Cocleimonas sp.]
MSDSLVSIRDVHFSWNPRREIYTGVSLEIPEGKITAIMGPSGTGKTTLLRLIGGQLRPSSGSVQVAGEEIPKLNREKLYKARRRMGMLFQSGALLTDLSVFENIAFPIREHYDFTESMIRDIVLMKLELVGLRGARDLMPSELSGGMKRRVALARAIVLDPLLMMYDEPFTGLDPVTLGTIVTLIKELNESLGLTSVIVSHDIRETFSIADHVCILSEGIIVAAGSPEELMNSDSEFVQQFVNGKPDGPMPFHYPAGDYTQDLLDGDI